MFWGAGYLAVRNEEVVEYDSTEGAQSKTPAFRYVHTMAYYSTFALAALCE